MVVPIYGYLMDYAVLGGDATVCSVFFPHAIHAMVHTGTCVPVEFARMCVGVAPPLLVHVLVVEKDLRDGFSETGHVQQG